MTSSTPPSFRCPDGDDEQLIHALSFQDQMTLDLIEVNYKAKQTKYSNKEIIKTRMATQFIGEGSAGSSTDRYRKVYGSMANTGVYTSEDIVMVASNGKRRGAILPVVVDAATKSPQLQGAYLHLEAAMEAGASLVMDDAPHLAKSRVYNVGEVALANYLEHHTMYKRVGTSGLWQRPKLLDPAHAHALEKGEHTTTDNI